jgi:hypothetical protein
MDADSVRKNIAFDQNKLKLMLHSMLTPGVSFERIQEFRDKISANKILAPGLTIYHLTGDEENEYYFQLAAESLKIIKAEARTDEELYALTTLLTVCPVSLHVLAFTPAMTVQASDE